MCLVNGNPEPCRVSTASHCTVAGQLFKSYDSIEIGTQ